MWKSRLRLVKFSIRWMLFALLLWACAVRTPVEQIAAPKDPGALKDIQVVFRTFNPGPFEQKGPTAMSLCKATAKQYLQSKPLFASVEDDLGKNYNGRTKFVDTHLLDLRLTQTAGRVFLGPFMGRSHMKIAVTISDQNGKSVAQKELLGAPNAMASTYSFGGTDRRLPMYMGQLLGDYIIFVADHNK